VQAIDKNNYYKVQSGSIKNYHHCTSCGLKIRRVYF